MFSHTQSSPPSDSIDIQFTMQKKCNAIEGEAQQQRGKFSTMIRRRDEEKKKKSFRFPSFVRRKNGEIRKQQHRSEWEEEASKQKIAVIHREEPWEKSENITSIVSSPPHNQPLPRSHCKTYLSLSSSFEKEKFSQLPPCSPFITIFLSFTDSITNIKLRSPTYIGAAAIFFGLHT